MPVEMKEEVVVVAAGRGVSLSSFLSLICCDEVRWDIPNAELMLRADRAKDKNCILTV